MSTFAQHHRDIATWQMWAPRGLAGIAHLQSSKSPGPAPNLPSPAPIFSEQQGSEDSMKSVIHAEPAHPCAAAGCIDYRRTELPARSIDWCIRHVTPMAPCVHLRACNGAHDDAGRTNGAFCGKPRKGRAAA